jgi:hypothetical protein
MVRFFVFIIVILTPLIGASQEISFQKHLLCRFSIDLPIDWRISQSKEGLSSGNCSYQVSLKNGYILMNLESKPIASLKCSDLRDCTVEALFQKALRESTLSVTYKFLGKGFFVISGFNKRNGNIVYWKRVFGDGFVSDMHLEYRDERRVAVDPHMNRISRSFVSR